MVNEEPVKTIVLANHKGGVGKTTSVLNLGPALAERGLRTLLIDLDPQANLTEGFGLEAHDGLRIEDVLVRGDGAGVAPATVAVGDRLAVVPTSWSLGSADADLAARGEGHVDRLREVLGPVEDDYDVVLVDTPPSIGMWSGLALLAADAVVVPVTPAHYDQMGAQKQLAFIEQHIRPANPDLQVLGVLVTKAQRRWRVLREIREAIARDAMPTIPGEVPLQIRVASAVGERRPSFFLEPDGQVAYAYRRAAEYIAREVGL